MPNHERCIKRLPHEAGVAVPQGVPCGTANHCQTTVLPTPAIARTRSRFQRPIDRRASNPNKSASSTELSSPPLSRAIRCASCRRLSLGCLPQTPFGPGDLHSSPKHTRPSRRPRSVCDHRLQIRIESKRMARRGRRQARSQWGSSRVLLGRARSRCAAWKSWSNDRRPTSAGASAPNYRAWDDSAHACHGHERLRIPRRACLPPSAASRPLTWSPD